MILNSKPYDISFMEGQITGLSSSSSSLLCSVLREDDPVCSFQFEGTEGRARL